MSTGHGSLPLLEAVIAWALCAVWMLLSPACCSNDCCVLCIFSCQLQCVTCGCWVHIGKSCNVFLSKCLRCLCCTHHALLSHRFALLILAVLVAQSDSTVFCKVELDVEEQAVLGPAVVLKASAGCSWRSLSYTVYDCADCGNMDR